MSRRKSSLGGVGERVFDKDFSLRCLARLVSSERKREFGGQSVEEKIGS